MIDYGFAWATCRPGRPPSYESIYSGPAPESPATILTEATDPRQFPVPQLPESSVHEPQRARAGDQSEPGDDHSFGLSSRLQRLSGVSESCATSGITGSHYSGAASSLIRYP